MRPSCCKCQNSFSYKSLLNTVFSMSKPMRCPHCGTVQYVTRKARMRISFFNSLLVFVFLLLPITNISFSFLLTLYIILSLIFIAFTPLLFSFSREEEPLW